ncbi:MAG: RnfABCDGE type electron transport complex subunit G [bacterium]
MKDFFKPILILTTICMVAAVILAKVYDITKEPIAEQKSREQLNAIDAVVPGHDNDPIKDAIKVSVGKDKRGEEQVIEFFRCFKQDKLVGVAFKAKTSEGFGGNIAIMIGVNEKGIITGIEILESQESPGLGAKILKPFFKDQFKGRSLQNTKWQVKKDGGDIDQITGATVSPRAVTKAVKEGLRIFEQFKEKFIFSLPTK